MAYKLTTGTNILEFNMARNKYKLTLVYMAWGKTKSCLSSDPGFSLYYTW